MFDPKTWQCAKCGRTGTLCLREIGARILHSVTEVDKHIVTGEFRHEKAVFDGYVCGECGMSVADTDEELMQQFK